MVDIKKEVQNVPIVQVSDDSSDDSDIEMIGVVTSDKRRFKTLKIEKEDDCKKSKYCFERGTVGPNFLEIPVS